MSDMLLLARTDRGRNKTKVNVWLLEQSSLHGTEKNIGNGTRCVAHSSHPLINTAGIWVWRERPWARILPMCLASRRLTFPGQTNIECFASGWYVSADDASNCHVFRRLLADGMFAACLSADQ